MHIKMIPSTRSTISTISVVVGIPSLGITVEAAGIGFITALMKFGMSFR
jgi:hypothetical protein